MYVFWRGLMQGWIDRPSPHQVALPRLPARHHWAGVCVWQWQLCQISNWALPLLQSVPLRSTYVHEWTGCVVAHMLVIVTIYAASWIKVSLTSSPISPHPSPTVFLSTYSHPTPDRVEGLPCASWPHVCRVSQSVWVWASLLRARARAGQGLVWPATRLGGWAEMEVGAGLQRLYPAD